MTIDELIRLTQSRLSFLNMQRSTAVARGDADQIARTDLEIAETLTTIAALQTLSA
jgi:hypothetical protein